MGCVYRFMLFIQFVFVVVTITTTRSQQQQQQQQPASRDEIKTSHRRHHQFKLLHPLSLSLATTLDVFERCVCVCVCFDSVVN